MFAHNLMNRNPACFFGGLRSSGCLWPKSVFAVWTDQSSSINHTFHCVLFSPEWGEVARQRVWSFCVNHPTVLGVLASRLATGVELQQSKWHITDKWFVYPSWSCAVELLFYTTLKNEAKVVFKEVWSLVMSSFTWRHAGTGFIKKSDL